MTNAVVTMSCAFAAVVTVSCSGSPFSGRASAAPGNAAARVERGKYLVSVAGCSDCHTPMKLGPSGPEPDMARFLSGHPDAIGALPPARASRPWPWTGAATNTAFSGPWGISYAANLTPDQNTGLGIWTEQLFIAAIRNGRHMGTSREILPPMPWPALRNASDEDLRSMYAYLRTLTPVTNRVPDPEIAAAPTAAGK